MRREFGSKRQLDYLCIIMISRILLSGRDMRKIVCFLLLQVFQIDLCGELYLSIADNIATYCEVPVSQSEDETAQSEENSDVYLSKRFSPEKYQQKVKIIYVDNRFDVGKEAFCESRSILPEPVMSLSPHDVYCIYLI